MDSGVLIKFDPDGNALWARTPIAGSALNGFGRLATDAEGNVYVQGTAHQSGTLTYGEGVTTNGSGPLVIKYSGSGTALWAKNGSNSYTNTWSSFYNGALYVSGTNATMVKYDAATGNLAWTKTGSSNSVFQSVSVDASGIYIAGYQTGTSAIDYGNSVSAVGASSGRNSVLLKYDFDGNAVSAAAFGAGTFDSEFTAVNTAAGTIYLVGYQKGTVEYDYGVGTIKGLSATENAVLIKKGK
jgi:hypothetical protein